MMDRRALADTLGIAEELWTLPDEPYWAWRERTAPYRSDVAIALAETEALLEASQRVSGSILTAQASPMALPMNHRARMMPVGR